MTETIQNTSQPISGFRKFLAVLVVLLFVLSSTLSMAAFAIRDKLTDPLLYQTILDDTLQSGEMRVLMTNVLLGSIQGQGALPMDVSPQALENLAFVLLPDTWLKETTDRLVSALLAYLNTPGAQLPDLNIDLAPVQAALSSQQGQDAVLQLLSSLPPCTTFEQLAALEQGQITCLPDEPYRSMVIQGVTAVLSGTIPKSLSLAELTTFGVDLSAVKDAAESLQTIQRNLTTVVAVGMLLSMGLYLIYLLLYIPHFLKLIRSAAVPLYTAGIFNLGLVFLGKAMLGSAPAIVSGFTGGTMGLAGQVAALVITSSGSLILNQWLNLTLIVLGMAVLLSIVGSVAGLFGRRG